MDPQCQKKWIGNSPWCDISIIWARDLADDQVQGVIVENKTTPGFKVEKIQNKIALKVVAERLDHDGELPPFRRKTAYKTINRSRHRPVS